MRERVSGIPRRWTTEGSRVVWSQIPRERPHAGVGRQRYDSERLTITRYRLAPGARYPIHAHEDEQVVHVQTGRVRFSVGDAVVVLRPGDMLHVEPNTPHGASAETEPAVFLTISPRRA